MQGRFRLRPPDLQDRERRAVLWWHHRRRVRRLDPLQRRVPKRHHLYRKCLHVHGRINLPDRPLQLRQHHLEWDGLHAARRFRRSSLRRFGLHSERHAPRPAARRPHLRSMRRHDPEPSDRRCHQRSRRQVRHQQRPDGQQHSAGGSTGQVAAANHGQHHHFVRRQRAFGRHRSPAQKPQRGQHSLDRSDDWVVRCPRMCLAQDGRRRLRIRSTERRPRTAHPDLQRDRRLLRKHHRHARCLDLVGRNWHQGRNRDQRTARLVELRHGPLALPGRLAGNG